MIGGFFDILASVFAKKLTDNPVNPLLTKGAPVTRDEAQKIVFKVCSDAGLEPIHAALVYSQGLQESGYDSNVFMKNNNAFGMKYSKNAFVMGKGTPAPGKESYKGDPRNFYAKYDSLANSVRDLLRRQKAFGIVWENMNDAASYIKFCKDTRYFQGDAKTYKGNIASFLKKFNIKTSHGN